MSLATLLNAHLAAGLAGLVLAIGTRFLESRSPSAARWVSATGLALVLALFLGTLMELRPVLSSGSRTLMTATVPPWTTGQPMIEQSPNAYVAPTRETGPAAQKTQTNGELRDAVGILWAAFILARLCILGGALLRLRAVLSRATPVDVDGRSVFEAEVAVPCLVGLFRPKLLVPTTFKDIPAEERRAALTHEFAHLKRGHLLDHALREIVRLPLGWFWPVKALICAHRDAQEADCDAMAAETLGEGRSLARALIRFSAQNANPASAGLALVPTGSSLQRRIHRLASEKKPMNMNILAQGLLVATFATVAVAASQSLRVSEPGVIPASAHSAAALSNLAPGNQWVYEFAWPQGQKSEFILQVTRKIPVQGGAVFELENHSLSLKGQPMKSYEYRQVLGNGVATALGGVNNTKPGFNLSQGGPLIPANLKPGYSWKWGGTGEASTGNAQTIQFEGIVQNPQVIDTPLGNKTATVIRITETVQWHSMTRVFYYVEGLGLVREVLLNGKGEIAQTLTMKRFIANAKPIIQPKAIDSRGGR